MAQPLRPGRSSVARAVSHPARCSTTWPTRPASTRTSPAAAVQGRDAHLRRARRARATRSPSALAELGVKRGDRRRSAAAELPAVPRSPSSAPGRLGAIVAPLNPIYTENELEGPLREHGIETIVTLTRFYQRVKRVQPRTPLTRVIATNIKEHFPPLLRFLFTLVRERKEGDRVRLAPGDHALAALLAAHRGRPARAVPLSPQRSGGAADERRHDRDAERRARHTWRVCDGRAAGEGVEPVGPRRRRQPDSAAAAAVPCLRQRRGPGAGARHAATRWRSSRTRATSPTCSRPSIA